MQKLQQILRKTLLGTMVFVQLFFFPAATFAVESTEQQTDTAVTSTGGEPSEVVETVSEKLDKAEEKVSTATEKATEPKKEEKQQGPQGVVGQNKPSAESAKTYVYNKETGLWENDHYTWDPVTKQTKPKQQQTYSYNPQTKMWDTKEWAYDPTTGKYEENTYSLNYNPAAKANSGQINGTGPNSTNSIDFDSTLNGTFDGFFDTTISNVVNSNAHSGDALLQGNTNAGDALSGDAAAIVNILNMLQSGWGTLGSPDIATFVANINGDVHGDLYLDPSQVNSNANNADVDVNIAVNNQINNDVNVNVGSGNATVDGNTNAGNATTGDATAIVNLINMINSAIYANKSFIGMININGNLNGDILLPEGMLEAIIAATGPGSNNTINQNHTTNANLSVETTRTINNDVNVDAQSGNALVDGNTTAGSATTGKANTNVMLLNLTGHHVVAKNAMLVFVNVLGSWVGLIMDAPSGTYGVAATGPDSTNTINADGVRDVDVNITENSEINNNVDVTATSGDATVTDNTNAGNAETGDANVGVNVLNMIDSTFKVSDWFGVLFINVFGSWFGSFGVNTEAGNKPIGSSPSPTTPTDVSNATVPPQVFNFVPRYSGAGRGSAGAPASVATAVSPDRYNDATGLSSATTPQQQASAARNTWILSIIALLAFVALTGGERLVAAVQRRRS